MSGKLNNCIFPFSIRVVLFLLAVIFTGSSCSTPETPPQRSIYYWKSVFHLNNTEKKFLEDAQITTLYLKYFDVDIATTPGDPVPVASLQVAPGEIQALPTKVSIVPVVFITQPALQQMADTALSRYANLIASRIEKMSGQFGITPKEWQIDCDWTATTSNRYFTLLQFLKKRLHQDQVELSVTLRLYPYKYRNKMGIPPADRVMLMCYNMGNLTNPATKNSILDPQEMDKYLTGAKAYPLPMDIALPLFSWFAWFRDREFKGLVYPSDVEKTGWEISNGRIMINSDTVLNGRQFLSGDWLRQEETTNRNLQTASALVKSSLQDQHLSRLAFFHLDSLILNKHNADALEALFDGIR